METVISSVFFCFRGKPAHSKFATKTTKKKIVNTLILRKETTQKIDILQRRGEDGEDEYSRSEFLS